MAAAGDEENDVVLSDVEADDPVPIVIKNPEDVSVEKIREILAELDHERAVREAAEKAKNDIQVSFNRLKVLCHEAIKKRDESTRQRDEAVREKDEALKNLERVSGDLSKEVTLREDALRHEDEVGKAMRVEMETASSMLVSGIERISSKVSEYRDFGNVLPNSDKYSGLPAVVYGVIKRTNEIVEDLLGQVESSANAMNEARQSVDQRNYQIAIEVSQLEATISGLRDDVANKSEGNESLKRSVFEKDGKIAELESENSRLRVLVSDYESKMEIQRPLLVDHLNYVTRMHEEMRKAMKIVDANKSSELSESLFVAPETDMEENIKASLAGMESVYELSGLVVEKTKDLVEVRNREVKKLSESVSQLIKEKEQIGALLRSTLSQRMSVDMSSKTTRLFKVAEKGLKDAGIEYKFSKFEASKGKTGSVDADENEVYALASTLENIIKQSQMEIIELKHSVEELRAESLLYKEYVDSQAKELIQWKQRVEELKEKERVANENVEELMMDIGAAEEEIMRWKVAAQQEADAGKTVEQEYIGQLASVREELEEARQAVIDLVKKLKFKEETAVAAMGARDAAERSLGLVDMRASRLRDRVEELSHQLDELETSRGSRRLRYVCWPWQWIGLDYLGSHPPQQTANEMELSEPLL